MEFWVFSTIFGEFFYINNAYPPPNLPPYPPPSPPKRHPPPLAGKILRPPTFFNLSTYGYRDGIFAGFSSSSPAISTTMKCRNISTRFDSFNFYLSNKRYDTCFRIGVLRKTETLFEICTLLISQDNDLPVRFNFKTMLIC